MLRSKVSMCAQHETLVASLSRRSDRTGVATPVLGELQCIWSGILVQLFLLHFWVMVYVELEKHS